MEQDWIEISTVLPNRGKRFLLSAILTWTSFGMQKMKQDHRSVSFKSSRTLSLHNKQNRLTYTFNDSHFRFQRFQISSFNGYNSLSFWLWSKRWIVTLRQRILNWAVCFCGWLFYSPYFAKLHQLIKPGCLSTWFGNKKVSWPCWLTCFSYSFVS